MNTLLLAEKEVFPCCFLYTSVCGFLRPSLGWPYCGHLGPLIICGAVYWFWRFPCLTAGILPIIKRGRTTGAVRCLWGCWEFWQDAQTKTAGVPWSFYVLCIPCCIIIGRSRYPNGLSGELQEVRRGQPCLFCHREITGFPPKRTLAGWWSDGSILCRFLKTSGQFCCWFCVSCFLFLLPSVRSLWKKSDGFRLCTFWQDALVCACWFFPPCSQRGLGLWELYFWLSQRLAYTGKWWIFHGWEGLC